MNNKIPFHQPIISGNINEICKKSLKIGWLTSGPQVYKFEEELKKKLDAKFVVALNSCTAALHLALAANGLTKNDKFIVPTYTFVASVEVGEYCGATPILIDSVKKTFNLDLNQVEDELKKDKKNKIKAIIPVHFAGLAVDMKIINYFADKYNLFVLEDAAHALETISNEGKVGSTNFAAAFSFYANKNITTGGEGGALATNNENFAYKIRKLSLHGMDKDGWNRFSKAGKWAYDVSELGYKYNMTDISASFGLDQLAKIDIWFRRRLEIVKQYNNELNKISGIITPEFIELNDHARHLYIIRIISEQWQINRDMIINEINQYGIGTSVHYIPIHMHSFYRKKYNYQINDFINAKELSKSVITLPLYPKLSNKQIFYIIEKIKFIWNKYKI